MQQNSESINDVKDFVMKSKSRLQKILQRLDWSVEGVVKNFNSNSIVTSSLPKPKKICTTKIFTYPESIVAKNSLTIETQELQKLLKSDQIEAPQNFRELQANFSREQKLQIYEHVISHTEKLENNTIPNVADGEISLAEIVAEKKREAKRKKRKFRKTKPTHIEEVRSLVDLQMQALLQFIGNQKEIKSEQNITKDRCNSERKRSRSRDDYRSNIVKYKDSIEKLRRRSKERIIERSRPSRHSSKERTTERRSRSKSYEHRKMGRSRENNKDSYRKSNFTEESVSYQRYRSKDYDNYHRKQSPQATSSRNNQSKVRYYGSSSSHTRTTYDKDYDDVDRKKYKEDKKIREESKSWDKEKFYSKQEKIDKHKDREHNSSYRHRSKERNNDHRSKHKRKH